jgi:hypothetical protein
MREKRARLRPHTPKTIGPTPTVPCARPNRVEREEQSAKGPLEALTDAVKGAAEYVK